MTKTYGSFACAQRSDDPQPPLDETWLTAGDKQTYTLEIPSNARLNEDSVALVTWHLRTDPDPGALEWTLQIQNGQTHQLSLVTKMTLNEDNPIDCAMQEIVKAKNCLAAGKNTLVITYSRGNGKLRITDVVVHFHVDV